MGRPPELFGGIGVQSELPRSDPKTIRKLVRERINRLGHNEGLILASPTNTIVEDVPLDSILAMYEEARVGEQQAPGQVSAGRGAAGAGRISAA
jgi:hypothetical protein